jgi:hypothetical protein
MTILSTAYYKEEVKIKSCVNSDLIYVVCISVRSLYKLKSPYNSNYTYIFSNWKNAYYKWDKFR